MSIINMAIETINHTVTIHEAECVEVTLYGPTWKPGKSFLVLRDDEGSYVYSTEVGEGTVEEQFLTTIADRVFATLD